MNRQKILSVLSEDDIIDALRPIYDDAVTEEKILEINLRQARAIEQLVLARVGAVRDQALEEAAAECDAAAMRQELATGQEGDDADTSLRATAWQMSVLASCIRALKGTPDAAGKCDHSEHVRPADGVCIECGEVVQAPAAAVADSQPDLRNALDTLVREAQAVADDYHRPRYTRLDEAIRWARLALSAPQPSSNPGPLAAVEETAAPVRWNPMDTAPRDGTIVQLLVEFDEGNIHDDNEPQATIGTNTFDDSEIDEWRFAGWSWCHDCWIEGTGKPIGWLPFHNPIAASTAGEQERT